MEIQRRRFLQLAQFASSRGRQDHRPAGYEGAIGELGYDPIGSTPEKFATRIKVEIENWAKVIRAANIKGE